MNSQNLSEKVFRTMFDNDYFSQWLDIKCIRIDPGSCVLQLKITKEMINGFGIAHGGIAYSLADSALAFASNSHGIKSVSIETSISHTRPLHEGDMLTATAEEKNLTSKTGLYYVTLTNQQNESVAFFKGTVYRTGKEWFPEQ